MTEHDKAAREILTPRNNWMLERAQMLGRGDGKATLGRELEAGERILVVEFDAISAALSALATRVERETRERTIEECAKLCNAPDERPELADGESNYGDAFGDGHGAGCYDCAAAIRALSGGSK